MLMIRKLIVASDPPNAALIIHGVNAGVVELLNPKYDNSTHTIEYEMLPLGNTSLNIPSQFEEVTLVIDIDTCEIE